MIAIELGCETYFIDQTTLRHHLAYARLQQTSLCALWSIVSVERLRGERSIGHGATVCCRREQAIDEQAGGVKVFQVQHADRTRAEN